MKFNNSNNNNSINSINSIRGGNVLASGGFGCIFKPALKCKNAILEPGKGEVSKLMTKKHADAEYSQIQTFKNILEDIPNYEDYFLVKGFSLCQPSNLSKEDKNNFHKCKALTKKGFTKDNINDPKTLDELAIINMPDGGIDVKNYISENGLRFFSDLNNALVDLLINGLRPMNALNLYHCDIKGGNILVSTLKEEKVDTFTTRLIDWGLSVNHKVKTGIPRRLYRRPFQYNVPWSNILFNHDFTKMYNSFLFQCEERKVLLDTYLVREFVLDYIFAWNKIRGVGHLKTINSFFKLLINNELPNVQSVKIKKHVIEYDFTYNYIVDYISQILLHFTKNGEFQILDYFNNVFIKNIDTWGLVMTYSTIIKYLVKSNGELNQLSKSELMLVNKIKYIMFHYLFESPLKVIDINKVAEELQSLNDILNANTNNNNNNNNNNIFKKDLKDFSELKGGSRIRNNKTYKNSKKRTIIKNQKYKSLIKRRRREKTVRKR
jgi:hypothetical protein